MDRESGEKGKPERKNEGGSRIKIFYILESRQQVDPKIDKKTTEKKICCESTCTVRMGVLQQRSTYMNITISTVYTMVN